MSGPSITLALGGGGARGVSHLGVIEALLESGITIERIVGVSIGSLAGAIYAFDPNIESALNRTLGYLLSPSFQRHQETLFGAKSKAGDETSGGLFTWYERVRGYLQGHRMLRRIVASPALLPGIVLQEVVDHLLPEADLRDAKVPLSIVAADLRSGHRVVLEKGSVRSAVQASSALPGIFPPVEIDEMLLCDIGVLYSLPTTVAKSYATQCLVAVDVSSGLKQLPNCDTALDVMMRMDEIGESLFRKYVRDAADVLIRPRVADVEWFDFSAAKRLVEAGRTAARKHIKEIKSKCDC